MARDRYRIFENHFPYFLTCTIVNWLPVFSHAEAVRFVLDSLAFLQRHQRMSVYAYVIMENHLHLIAQSEKLSSEVRKFKSFTARCIIDMFIARRNERVLRDFRYYKLRHRWNREFQLWQEGSHPKQIRDVEVMRQKINYIHANPVRRGYVDDPLHWRYSSARNYAGEEGLIDVETSW